MSTAVTKTSSSNPKDALLEQFLDMLGQFLSALQEVFPECPAIAGYNTMFKFKMGGSTKSKHATGLEGISDWHRNMRAYYDDIRNKKESVFYAKIPIMSSLRISEKLTPSLHPETKDAVWEYLQRLNDLANMHEMYESIPGGMMSNIQSMASDLAQKIQSGEVSFNELNLMQLGEQVASSVDPEELEQFSSRIAASPGGSVGALGNLYSAMNTMMRK